VTRLSYLPVAAFAGLAVLSLVNAVASAFEGRIGPMVVDITLGAILCCFSGWTLGWRMTINDLFVARRAK
jgi:hypothetical protein